MKNNKTPVWHSSEIGSPFGYTARGHISAAELQWLVLVELDDVAEIDPARVRHTHLRFVPDPHTDEWWTGVYHETKPGRGAFAATCYDFEPGEWERIVDASMDAPPPVALHTGGVD